ncbi:hypothetical protein [Nocardia sp. X0981]
MQHQILHICRSARHADIRGNRVGISAAVRGLALERLLDERSIVARDCVGIYSAEFITSQGGGPPTCDDTLPDRDALPATALLTHGLTASDPFELPADLGDDPPAALLLALAERPGTEPARVRAMTMAGLLPVVTEMIRPPDIERQEVFDTYVRQHAVLLRPGETTDQLTGHTPTRPPTAAAHRGTPRSEVPDHRRVRRLISPGQTRLTAQRY